MMGFTALYPSYDDRISLSWINKKEKWMICGKTRKTDIENNRVMFVSVSAPMAKKQSRMGRGDSRTPSLTIKSPLIGNG